MRGLPGIPRALLTQRLGSLRRAGLIERRPTRTGRGWECHLSPAGRSFGPVVETEAVVTFLLPVGAPITVDAPAPRTCRL